MRSNLKRVSEEGSNVNNSTTTKRLSLSSRFLRMGGGRTRINSLPGSIKKNGKGGVTPPSSIFSSSRTRPTNAEAPLDPNIRRTLDEATSILDVASPSTLKASMSAPSKVAAADITHGIAKSKALNTETSKQNQSVSSNALQHKRIHYSHEILKIGIKDCGRAPRVHQALGETVKGKKFEKILTASNADLNQLKKIAWNGVPTIARPAVWQILLGYLPSNRGRREATLQRKRGEYRAAVQQYWKIEDSRRTKNELRLIRQISVDIPRTHPDIPLFHTQAVQNGLERVLYIWSIKHPASGYVQGMNDLVTPFYLVFLGAFIDNPRACDITRVPIDVLDAVEADAYWCLTKLLDGIQDHYTPSQPGIQRMIHRMEELVRRIDADLYKHLENENLVFMQFAFRWMNCLLMRELSLNSTVRLWDTYLAESGNGFDAFHIYVCTSFLVLWSKVLKEKPFQDLITFLQRLPTQNWTDTDVEMLVSQAFILQTQFQFSKAHLR
eukprot:g15808.t1